MIILVILWLLITSCGPSGSGTVNLQNACNPDPCQNGSQCQIITQADNSFTYKCLCPLRYQGVNCEKDLCADITCINGDCAIKTSLDGQKLTPACACKPGYTGINCHILCNSPSCGQSGSSCHSNAECDYYNDYYCLPNLLDEEQHCEHVSGDLAICNDDQDCLHKHCTVNDETAVKAQAGVCDCDSAHYGDNCTYEVASCLAHGGHLVSPYNTALSAYCACSSLDYMGPSCENFVDLAANIIINNLSNAQQSLYTYAGKSYSDYGYLLDFTAIATYIKNYQFKLFMASSEAQALAACQQSGAAGEAGWQDYPLANDQYLNFLTPADLDKALYYLRLRDNKGNFSTCLKVSPNVWYVNPLCSSQTAQNLGTAVAFPDTEFIKVLPQNLEVRGSCSVGYQQSGNLIATCLPTGQWLLKSGSCGPLDCGALPANAVLPAYSHYQNFTSLYTGTSLQLACNANYQVKSGTTLATTLKCTLNADGQSVSWQNANFTGTCLGQTGAACQVNSDCVDVCINHLCAPKAPLSGSCDETADCLDSNALCNSLTNTCLIPSVGTSCDTDSSCNVASGLHCSPNTPKICGGSGASCSNNLSCASSYNLYCRPTGDIINRQQECLPRGQAGDTCNSSADCQYNNCTVANDDNFTGSVIGVCGGSGVICQSGNLECDATAILPSARLYCRPSGGVQHCLPAGAAGDSCNEAQDCLAANCPINNPASNVGGVCGALNSNCLDNAECISGAVCVPSGSTAHVCKLPIVGGNCDTGAVVSDCPTGPVTVNCGSGGVCGGSGALCTSNAACDTAGVSTQQNVLYTCAPVDLTLNARHECRAVNLSSAPCDNTDGDADCSANQKCVPVARSGTSASIYQCVTPVLNTICMDNTDCDLTRHLYCSVTSGTLPYGTCGGSGSVCTSNSDCASDQNLACIPDINNGLKCLARSSIGGSCNDSGDCAKLIGYNYDIGCSLNLPSVNSAGICGGLNATCGSTAVEGVLPLSSGNLQCLASSNYTCVNKLCQDKATLTSGSCDDDNDCLNNLKCSTSGSLGTCGGSGALCTNNSACNNAQSLYCLPDSSKTKQICASPSPIGGPCNDLVDCQNNNCTVNDGLSLTGICNALGSVCQNNAGCSNDTVCAPNSSGQHFCIMPAMGSMCDANDDCPTTPITLACSPLSNGLYGYCGGSGAICTNNGQCDSSRSLYCLPDAGSSQSCQNAAAAGSRCNLNVDCSNHNCNVQDDLSVGTAAGICGGSGAVCSSNNDCDSSKGYACIPGANNQLTCLPLSPLGGSCNDSSDCAKLVSSNYNVSCNVNTLAYTQGVCGGLNALCGAALGVSIMSSGNLQCFSPYTCINNVCQDKATLTLGSCDDDGDCGVNAKCSTSGSLGTCGGSGAVCTGNIQCNSSSGLYCLPDAGSSQSCQNAAPVGGRCNLNADCSTQNCTVQNDAAVGAAAGICGGSGAVCQSNQQCFSSYTCIGNICKEKATLTSGSCDDDGDCGVNAKCSTSGSLGTCGGSGAICTGNIQCNSGSGLYCLPNAGTSQSCGSAAPVGGRCNLNVDCSNQNCTVQNDAAVGAAAGICGGSGVVCQNNQQCFAPTYTCIGNICKDKATLTSGSCDDDGDCGVNAKCSTSGSLGTCGGSGAICTGNIQCNSASGLYCLPDAGTSQSCGSAAPVGGRCNLNVDCSNQNCTVQNDAAVGAAAGICGGSGAVCQSNQQCFSPYTCIGNLCKDKATLTSGSCDDDGDCGVNAKCSTSGSLGTCGGSGAICTGNIQCNSGSGLYCLPDAGTSQSCGSAAPVGGRCNLNVDCSTQNCTVQNDAAVGAAAGTCGGSGAVCTGNIQCNSASGLYCLPDAGTSQSCTSAAPVGGRCNLNVDCSNQNCTVQNDAAVGAAAGICGGSGAVCQSNQQCLAPTYTCIGNLCKDKATLTSGSCDDDGDCGVNAKCSTSGSLGTCGGSGAICTGNIQCNSASGLYCLPDAGTSQSCGSAAPVGGRCNLNVDCSNQNCTVQNDAAVGAAAGICGGSGVVCQNNQQCFAPTYTCIGNICKDKATLTSGSCDDDGDCGVNAKCSTSGSLGTCGGSGAVCTGNIQCNSASGLYCLPDAGTSQSCTSAAPVGGRCNLNADCRNHNCTVQDDVAVGGSAGACGGSGAVCIQDQECLEVCIGGICKGKSSNGGPCDDVNDCQSTNTSVTCSSGHICIDNNQPCANNSDCAYLNDGSTTYVCAPKTLGSLEHVCRPLNTENAPCDPLENNCPLTQQCLPVSVNNVTYYQCSAACVLNALPALPSNLKYVSPTGVSLVGDQYKVGIICADPALSIESASKLDQTTQYCLLASLPPLPKYAHYVGIDNGSLVYPYSAGNFVKAACDAGYTTADKNTFLSGGLRCNLDGTWAGEITGSCFGSPGAYCENTSECFAGNFAPHAEYICVEHRCLTKGLGSPCDPLQGSDACPTNYQCLDLLSAGGNILDSEFTGVCVPSTSQIGNTIFDERPLEVNPYLSLEGAMGFSLNNGCVIDRHNVVRCFGDPAHNLADTYYVSGHKIPQSVVLSDTFACILLIDGMMECFGELGIFGSQGGRMIYDLSSENLKISQIAAAGYYVCMLLDNGTMRCLSLSNEYGEASNRDFRSSSGKKISKIFTALQYVTCVLLEDHSAYCFGVPDYVDIYNQYLGSRAGQIQNLAVGDRHACMLLRDAEVQCFGYDKNGELLKDVYFTDVAEVAVGSNYTCIRYLTGKVQCSGEDAAGNLIDSSWFNTLTQRVLKLAPVGLGPCAVLSDYGVYCAPTTRAQRFSPIEEDGKLLLSGSLLQTTPPPGDLQAEQILAVSRPYGGNTRKEHLCLIASDGQLVCIGDNTFGQVNATDLNQFLKDNPSLQFKSVAVGYAHTCVLLSDNTVRCIGSNNYGQIANLSLPLGTSKINALVAAENHTCIIIDQQKIQCVGYNAYNAMFNKDFTPNQILAADTGHHHTCVGLSNRKIECTGDNSYGQAPLLKEFTADILKISVGAYHTCVLLADGSMLCFGWANGWDMSGKYIPYGEELLYQETGRQIIDIAAGFQHTCMVFADGGVTCLGDNLYGQLWAADSSRVNIPAAKIVAGNFSTCVVFVDGRVSCVGDNRFGQLGTRDNHGFLLTRSSLRTDTPQICNDNQQCLGEFTCIQGICQERSALAGICDLADDMDCFFPYVCQNGVCQDITCSNPPANLLGTHMAYVDPAITLRARTSAVAAVTCNAGYMAVSPSLKLQSSITCNQAGNWQGSVVGTCRQGEIGAPCQDFANHTDCPSPQICLHDKQGGTTTGHCALAANWGGAVCLQDSECPVGSLCSKTLGLSSAVGVCINYATCTVTSNAGGGGSTAHWVSPLASGGTTAVSGICGGVQAACGYSSTLLAVTASAANQQCASGLTCINTQCAPLSRLNSGVCDDNADCLDHTACSFTSQNAWGSQQGVCGGMGALCNANADCALNLVCVPERFTGMTKSCALPLGPGGSCDEDSDCLGTKCKIDIPGQSGTCGDLGGGCASTGLNSSCLLGMVCIPGDGGTHICDYPALGKGCDIGSTNDCPQGAVSIACGSAGICGGSGALCQVNEGCDQSKNLSCIPIQGKLTCQPLSTAGGLCNDTGDCPAYINCTVNTAAASAGICGGLNASCGSAVDVGILDAGAANYQCAGGFTCITDSCQHISSIGSGVCDDDRDCQDGSHCTRQVGSALTTGVCGGTGALCENNIQCDQHVNLTCMWNGDLLSTNTQVCAPISTGGGYCNEDSDCLYHNCSTPDLTVLNGICGALGLVCDSSGLNNSCMAGTVCVPAAVNGDPHQHRCVTPAVGNTCDDDTDCDPKTQLLCLQHLYRDYLTCLKKCLAKSRPPLPAYAHYTAPEAQAVDFMPGTILYHYQGACDPTYTGTLDGLMECQEDGTWRGNIHGTCLGDTGAVCAINTDCQNYQTDRSLAGSTCARNLCVERHLGSPCDLSEVAKGDQSDCPANSTCIMGADGLATCLGNAGSVGCVANSDCASQLCDNGTCVAVTPVSTLNGCTEYLCALLADKKSIKCVGNDPYNFTLTFTDKEIKAFATQSPAELSQNLYVLFTDGSVVVCKAQSTPVCSPLNVFNLGTRKVVNFFRSYKGFFAFLDDHTLSLIVSPDVSVDNLQYAFITENLDTTQIWKMSGLNEQSCALFRDGKVRCTGLALYNAYDYFSIDLGVNDAVDMELGHVNNYILHADGSLTDTCKVNNVLQQCSVSNLQGSLPIIQLKANYQSMCVLYADRKLKCLGEAFTFNQQDSYPQDCSNITNTNSPIIQIATGMKDYVCVQFANGEVKCCAPTLKPGDDPYKAVRNLPSNVFGNILAPGS